VLVFWRGECRPLPADDAGLCALARCGASSWRKAGKTVRAALAQINPQLEREYARAVQRAETYRQAKAEAGRKGAYARWHPPLATASADSRLHDPAISGSLTVPRRAHSRASTYGLQEIIPGPTGAMAGRLRER